MKRNLLMMLFAIMVLGMSLSGCRKRELCPAYTDSRPLTEENSREIS